MRKSAWLAVVFLVLGLFFSGFAWDTQAGERPVEVTVSLQEYKVVLSRTNLPAGVPIQFTFKDMGSVVHEAVLEKAGMVDEPLEIEGKEAEVEDLQPGETRSITWTIEEVGAYQLACHIAGHFEGGMLGLFNVRPGGEFVSLLFENAVWIVAGLLTLILLGLVGGLQLRRQKKSAT